MVFSDFTPAPDEFNQYLAIIEATGGINEQPIVRYGRDEVCGPLSKEAFLQLGSKLGPEWQACFRALSATFLSAPSESSSRSQQRMFRQRMAA